MPEPVTKKMCPRCKEFKVLRNVPLVAPKRCLVCACRIDGSDTEPCVSCKQVVVPLGAQYCPLCLTPQEVEGLPTSVVDQIRCEGMDEEMVMHTCIARSVCCTECMLEFPSTVPRLSAGILGICSF